MYPESNKFFADVFIITSHSIGADTEVFFYSLEALPQKCEGTPPSLSDPHPYAAA